MTSHTRCRELLMRGIRLLVCLSALALALAAGAQAAPVASYTYDANGRLATVENASGQLATYGYDKVGNLLSIIRSTALGPVAAPRTGAARDSRRPFIASIGARRVRVGRFFSIWGGGFDPRAAADFVKVGSLLATVVRARPSELTVAAPPDAGGRVSVHTAAGTALGGSIVVVGGPVRRGSAGGRVSHPLRAPRGITALSGQVETAAGRPLASVVLTVSSAWRGGATTTRSNASGRFLLSDLSSGPRTLVIDAAHLPGGQDFGTYSEPVQLPEGRTSVLPWITHLTPIDTAHTVRIASPTRARVVLTSPRLPGVRVIVPAGTVIRDHAGRVVRALSLTPLRSGRTPFPWGAGMAPPYFTVQPGDATVSGPGLQIVYPNVAHRAPGTAIPYLAENGRWPRGGWYRYGTGHVSHDGRSILPDARTRYHTTDPGGDATVGAPAGGPAPGDQCTCGDPVNLATGLFLDQATDIALPDTEGITLARSFRQLDDTVRDFGIGGSDSFNTYVVPDGGGNVDLVLPNGGRVVYTPTATSGVFAAVATPTSYSGSTLTETSGWDIYGPWLLKMRNGTQLSFGDPAYLDAVTDRFGNTVTFNRAQDGSGAIQSVTTPNGRWLNFTWGNCVSGTTTTCITAVADNSGRTVHYAYDASGRLTTVTDVNGGVTTYAWAACADPVTCTEVTSITDPMGRKTSIVYGTTGFVSKETQPNGGVWRYAYSLSSTGAITGTTVTDPLGEKSRSTVAGNGYSSSNTVGYGTTLAQTSKASYYAGTGLVKTATDPLGRVTAYTYDANGNPTSVTQLYGTADAAKSTYTYESAFNRLATVRDPLGRKTTYTYDDTYNTETITDPLGHKTTVRYNAHGQTVWSRDPLGNTTYYSYVNGDLAAVANPLGNVSSTAYDAVGRPLQVTDADGNTTSYTYDAAGDKLTSTDPLGRATRFSYDHDGELVSVTDAQGHKTAYVRDKLGHITSETDPLGKSQTWTYDLGGNVVASTDRNGHNSTFTYDGLGRLTTSGYGVVSGTPTESVSTAYDSANRPTSVTDSLTGTYSTSYDDRNEVLSATAPQGTISYSYNVDGERTGMTVAGQSPVAYTYDADGHLTSLVQGASSAGYAYDAAGRLSTQTLPNGVDETYAYDAASELTSTAVVGPGSTSIGTATYTYEPDGRIASVDGSLANATLPAAVTSAAYNADNEMTSFNGKTLSYDSNGNLLSDGTNSFSWNALNQLSSVTTPSATSTYTYDPAGDRVSANSGGTTIADLFDGRALVQQSSGGSAVANYLETGVGGTVQVTNSAGTFSPLANQVGSTVGLTGSAGTLTTTTTYDPAGNATTSGSANPDPQGFATGRTDAAGLVEMGARYYDPAIGRFISQDPMGLSAGSPNLYEYAGDDPISANDPTGLCGGWGCVGEGFVDFVAGAANGITGGIFNIKAPFCGPGLNWAYDAGNVAGTVAGFLIPGDDALEAVGASLRAARGLEAAGDAFNAGRDLPIASALVRSKADTIVLGHFPQYTQEAERIGARTFSVPKDIWDAMTPEAQWAANQKFLDRAIARGSDIRLATAPDAAREGSFYERELQYLESQGYSVSSDGTTMIPPGG